MAFFDRTGGTIDSQDSMFFTLDVSSDQFLGCLVGLAVGDAVGTTLEFKEPGSFAEISDMVGGGPFRLEAGQWTDDTSMALCLAESLITRSGFDPVDQLQRYWCWYQDGYMSSTGSCFDIGCTVLESLRRFRKTGRSDSGSTAVDSAGNGSLMRLAPVVMFYGGNAESAIRYSGESSLTTHGAESCIDACRYFGGLVWAALNGTPKDRLLSSLYAPVPDIWERQPLCSAVHEIALGSYKQKNPPEIVGSGYVVRSLEAALWAFYHAKNFRHGCLLAVNLGNDADTTGAIYGQIAGAFYGRSGIPDEWLRRLSHRTLIEKLAGQLQGLSNMNTA